MSNREIGDIPNVSPLYQAAIAMKEAFDSFIEAGFTEDQTIKILVSMFGPNFEGDQQ